jgi:hypothetical protein
MEQIVLLIGMIWAALATISESGRSDTIGTLPTFFVVGAAKSGTTSLYHYLGQHPDIYMPHNKEPHWFSRVPYIPGQGAHPVTSEEEYLKLFKGRTMESAIGEASPSYLWDKKTPYRIKETVPHAKIIAILRHPVERAYSHYMMDVRADKQHLPFMEALMRDQDAKNKGWGVSDLYLDLGFYAEQVERYYEAFGRSQVKVFLYEDLRQDPKSLLRSAFAFLGTEPSNANNIRTDVQYNKYSVPKNRLAKTILGSRMFRARRSSKLRAKLISNDQTRAQIRSSLLFKDAAKSTMDAESRRFLMDLYRPDIQKLQGLLNRDLGHWLWAEDGN